MKNFAIVLFIIAVLVSLSGCGIANAVDSDCTLTTLKIKSVAIEGDTDGLVAGAVERELYSKGAVSDQTGVKITGKVNHTPGGLPEMTVVVRAESNHFSAIAESSMPDPEDAASQIGRRVAHDFCRCSTGRGSNPPPPLPKK